MDIKPEHRNAMFAEMTESLGGIMKRTLNSADFISAVEEEAHDDEVAYTDDEIEESEDEEDAYEVDGTALPQPQKEEPEVNFRDDVIDLMNDPRFSNDSKEDLQNRSEGMHLCNRVRVKLQKTYRSKRGAQPATAEDTEKNFSKLLGAFNSLSDYIKRSMEMKTEAETNAYREAVEKAVNEDDDNSWASKQPIYKKDVYTNKDGNEVSITKVAEPVDWGRMLSKSAGSTEACLKRLRMYVTTNVVHHFGGYRNIKSIVVRDCQLIVNDVMYIPVLEKKYLNNVEVFPLDTQEYLKTGHIAPLFYWDCLNKLTCLYELDIDDVNFALRDLANDLGLGCRFGVSSLFRVASNLQIVTIGGETVTRESLKTKESVPVKQKISIAKRFWNFEDGYKLNVLGATNGLQNYTFTNLKNYATNRGNKGIFRFCCGTVARGVLAGTAGVTNLGAHLVRGVVNVFRDATIPITESEMTNQSSQTDEEYDE